MSVTVQIKYQNVEETFSGEVDQVWASVNRFFGQTIPVFRAMQDAVLTVNLKQVLDASKGLVAAAEEGPVVLASKRKLTDSESLLLMLLAAFLGGRLGVLKKLWLSRDELQTWLGKPAKITGTRLAELCREGFSMRTQEGNYQLTTYGVKHLVEVLLPSIRKKL